VSENPEVEEWLGSVSEATAKLYIVRFQRFFDWLTAKGEFEGFTPSQLLDFQDNATGRSRVRIANRLGLYCKRLGEELRPKTVTHYYSVVRSFFAYHGCDLPKRGFSLPDNHKEPSEQKLTRDALVKIVQAAKLRDKTIYVCAFMGAMGWNEFNQFDKSWDQVAPQLDPGEDHIIIKLKARKKKRGLTNGYYTIIGADGVALLRQYLKERGVPKPGESIFLSREGGFLAGRTYRKNFEMLCRRVGLIKGRGVDRTSRLGYSPHQLRDVFRTEFQRSGADLDVAEFLMGHVVDANKYLQFSKIPDYVVEEYKKAEGRLSIISNPDTDVVSSEAIEELQRQVSEQQRTIDMMMPAFEMIQQQIARRNEWNRLRDGETSPKRAQVS